MDRVGAGERQSKREKEMKRGRVRVRAKGWLGGVRSAQRWRARERSRGTLGCEKRDRERKSESEPERAASERKREGGLDWGLVCLGSREKRPKSGEIP